MEFPKQPVPGGDPADQGLSDRNVQLGDAIRGQMTEAA